MAQWLSSVVIGIAVSTTLAHGHHSISGMYDTGQQVTIEGVIARFEFVNPHPFVVIDVEDGSGQAEQWQLEMDNRRELAAIGVTPETLKSGDRVVVSGNLGRAQPHRLYVRRLDRPADGLRYEQVGRSPRIGAVSE